MWTNTIVLSASSHYHVFFAYTCSSIGSHRVHINIVNRGRKAIPHHIMYMGYRNTTMGNICVYFNVTVVDNIENGYRAPIWSSGIKKKPPLLIDIPNNNISLYYSVVFLFCIKYCLLFVEHKNPHVLIIHSPYYIVMYIILYNFSC